MSERLKVIQLVGSDVRPYRIPLLKRIADSGRVSLTVWHGEARSGMGAPVASAVEPPVPVRKLRNVFWPVKGHRVAWQRGALGVLRSDCDVVICTEAIPNLSVWLIAVLHRFFGKGLTLHGHYVRPNRHTLMGSISAMVRWALHRLADTYIAYTDEGRDVLISEGVAPEKIFVSNNTLDTEALTSIANRVAPADVSSLREELRLPSGPVLLYLGRLIPVKRVEVAIEIVKELGLETSLVVIGDGYQRDELEELATGLPVRFLGAIYDEVELAPYLELADLLVLPGRVGLTCIHGFASGVPCVTTTDEVVEQSPEYVYIEHLRNGLILPTDDARDHVVAIRDLLTDPEKMNRLREGSLETARGLSMEKMVEEFEAAVFEASALRP